MQQKRYSDAVACAREAIKADPKLSNGHSLLAFALKETGDIPGAAAALTEAVRLDPKRWEPLLAKLRSVPIAPPPREVRR